MPKTLTEAEISSFRERLCDVAEELFAAHGPDGVTMRQLAETMGVSSMTAYRYFADKDAILAAVRTRAFNRFAEAMECKAGEIGHPEPGSASGEAYIDFALANPNAYRMMFDVSQPTFETYPGLLKAMERARLTMGQNLRDLAKTGRFKGDVELWAHMFWSAMHGAIMLELAGLLRRPIDARTILRPTLATLSEKLGVKG